MNRTSLWGVISITFSLVSTSQAYAITCDTGWVVGNVKGKVYTPDSVSNPNKVIVPLPNVAIWRRAIGVGIPHILVGKSDENGEFCYKSGFEWRFVVGDSTDEEEITWDPSETAPERSGNNMRYPRFNLASHFKYVNMWYHIWQGYQLLKDTASAIGYAYDFGSDTDGVAGIKIDLGAISTNRLSYCQATNGTAPWSCTWTLNVQIGAYNVVDNAAWLVAGTLLRQARYDLNDDPSFYWMVDRYTQFAFEDYFAVAVTGDSLLYDEYVGNVGLTRELEAGSLRTLDNFVHGNNRYYSTIISRLFWSLRQDSSTDSDVVDQVVLWLHTDGLDHDQKDLFDLRTRTIDGIEDILPAGSERDNLVDLANDHFDDIGVPSSRESEPTVHINVGGAAGCYAGARKTVIRLGIIAQSGYEVDDYECRWEVYRPDDTLHAQSNGFVDYATDPGLTEITTQLGATDDYYAEGSCRIKGQTTVKKAARTYFRPTHPNNCGDDDNNGYRQ